MNNRNQNKKKLLSSDLIQFHTNTSLTENNLVRNSDYPSYLQSAQYKDYDRFSSIKLPSPKMTSFTLFDSLSKRKSVRVKGKKMIALEDISTMLYLSAGINVNKEFPRIIKRRYPSTGAMYPIEIYMFHTKGVDMLDQGIYHYDVKQHALTQINKGTNAISLQKMFTSETRRFIGKNSVILFFSCVFTRIYPKYQDRSYRYCLLETGHIVENIYLISESLAIGCCEVGGFFDQKVNTLLDLTEKEQVLSTLVLNQN